MGEVEEAQKLIDMASKTNEGFEYILDWGRTWWGRKEKYWDDLKNRGITTEKWRKRQWILLLNTESIIAASRNDLKSAIKTACLAIHWKDCAIKRQVFTSESKDDFVLYSN